MIIQRERKVALQFQPQSSSDRRMGSSTERCVLLPIASRKNTEYCAVDVLPMATEMAGVNIRLEGGAVRFVQR